MKITVDRKQLVAALKTATVTSTSGAIPILSGIHVDAAADGTVTVTGTNLDLSISTRLIASKVETPGAVVLPGRVARPLIEKAATDTVTISLDGDRAVIDAGGVATINTFPLSSWPDLAIAAGKSFELDPFDVDRVARVLHAASADDARGVIVGVHFVGNKVRATDSYRLVIAELSCDDLPDKVVPADVIARAVQEAPAGLQVAFDSRSVTLTDVEHGTTWTSRLLVGEFPTVERLVNDAMPFQLVVERERVVEALKWVGLIPESTTGTDLDCEGSTLTISGSENDVGNATVDMPCTGTWAGGIRLNHRFLLDALTVVADADEVAIELAVNDGGRVGKPIQIRSADRHLVTVLMPIARPQ